MPRIIDYSAPRERFTPSDRSQQAWETAGRRIGPLYNEVASTTREVARAQAATYKGRQWPYDFDSLSQQSGKGSSSSGGGGDGFKVKGGVGSKWGSAGSNPEADRYHPTKKVGEVSAGAAALSKAAKDMVDSGLQTGKTSKAHSIINGDGVKDPWNYAPGNRPAGPDVSGWSTDDAGNLIYGSKAGVSYTTPGGSDAGLASEPGSLDAWDYRSKWDPDYAKEEKRLYNSSPGYEDNSPGVISDTYNAIKDTLGNIFGNSTPTAETDIPSYDTGANYGGGGEIRSEDNQ